jgi:hypothetical protein
MSCADCFKYGRDLLAEQETIIQQAKEYAREKNVSTAIYKTEEGYNFCSALYAYEHGYPILQVVSKH